MSRKEAALSATGLAQQIHRSQAERLRGKVLVHVGDNSRGEALAVHCDGLVFRGTTGFKEAKACRDDVLRLVDRELYVDDRGRSDQAQLIRETHAESVAAQVAAGAGALLAPSRFPADREAMSLARSLEAGADFVQEAAATAPELPTFVPVVVRFDELADRRWVAPIKDSGLPIATVFAGYGDPLATPERLEGAVDIVKAALAAFVMRCDMSVAGLMALEAVAGAIGASSSVRHLWLPSRGKARPPSRYLFVPRLANWMKVSFVEQALADPDLDELFQCECVVCGEGGDLRALTMPDVSSEIQDRHSAASAVDLAHTVLEDERPVDAWRSRCQAASAAYDEFDRLGISGPTKPGVLNAWLSVLG